MDMMSQVVEHLRSEPDFNHIAAMFCVQAVWWYFGVTFWYYVYDWLLTAVSGQYRVAKEVGKHKEILTQLSTTMYYWQAATFMLIGTLLSDGPGNCVRTTAWWYGAVTQTGHDFQDLFKIFLEVPRYPHTSIFPVRSGKPFIRQTTVMSFLHHAGSFTAYLLPLPTGPWTGFDIWWLTTSGSVMIKNLYNAARALGESNCWHPDVLLVLHLIGFLGWTLTRISFHYDLLFIMFQPGWPRFVCPITMSMLVYTVQNNSRIIWARVVDAWNSRGKPPAPKAKAAGDSAAPVGKEAQVADGLRHRSKAAASSGEEGLTSSGEGSPTEAA